MKPAAKQGLLTGDEAETFLRVSRTTLWRLRKSGSLPAFKVGGQVRYETGDLRAWLKGQGDDLRESPAEYVVSKPGRRHEQSWARAIEAQDWSFFNDATDSLTHGIHPYPAKFPPQLPARLIEILSKPGDVVLDPFCGSGTTLVEALRLGRMPVGVDINPIAVLVSEVKTIGLGSLADLKLEELEQALESDAARERGEPNLFSAKWPTCKPVAPPPITNLTRWFSASAVREVGLALARIDGLNDETAQKVGRAALSAVLVTVSNQDSETRYTARVKSQAPGDTLSILNRKLRSIRQRLLAIRELAATHKPTVLLADARNLNVASIGPVDAVVTSPPYANAFDYHLYHRHRLFWLGHDPADLRKSEIGSHLNYQRSGDGVESYRRDMGLCLESLATLLKPGGPCAFVVGDSMFFGKIVDNAKLLVDAAREVGFRCLTVVERRIHPVKRSMIAAARRARIERIVVLVRA